MYKLSIIAAVSIETPKYKGIHAVQSSEEEFSGLQYIRGQTTNLLLRSKQTDIWERPPAARGTSPHRARGEGWLGELNFYPILPFREVPGGFVSRFGPGMILDLVKWCYLWGVSGRTNWIFGINWPRKSNCPIWNLINIPLCKRLICR